MAKFIVRTPEDYDRHNALAHQLAEAVKTLNSLVERSRPRPSDYDNGADSEADYERWNAARRDVYALETYANALGMRTGQFMKVRFPE